MTADLAIAIALLALGVLVGWFASLRYAHPPVPPPPPLSPADIEALKKAFKSIFAQFTNNTTMVVSGLQDDINGLRDAVERISAWAPGQELDNPAQVSRWMGDSSTDRADIRRQLRRQRRWIVALTVAVVAGLPMIAVVFARVVWGSAS